MVGHTMAALARIASIPAGPTLIDLISDDEWLDDAVATWKPEAGSDQAGPSEELDDSDDALTQ